MIRIFCDGLIHILELNPDSSPNLASYTSSSNTQTALAAAYAAGDWEPYTPPEPEPIAPESNPVAFRAALAQTPSWFAWAETLSSVAYTNLTIAAAQGNWAEALAIYQAIKASTPPAPSSIAEWQALADQHAIPITF